MRASEEKRREMVLWEDRLERAQLRRTGLPAGMLLFILLSLFLFWNDYTGEDGLWAGLAWTLSFGVGVIVLVVVNELTARRTIHRATAEIDTLRSEASMVEPEGVSGVEV